MSHRRPRTRILFMIDYATSTGGAERLAVGLATHLAQDRFEPWMCATRSSDAVASRVLAAAGVRHLTLGRSAKWDVHRLGTVARLLRAERIDILHTHKFGSNLWGTLIGSACHIPAIVAHEHSWSYQGNPPRAWLDGKVIGRLATRFVAVSSADAQRMVDREGVSPDKVTVIPNGYIPSPGTSDNDVRAELGLDRSVPVIGIAAVLRPEKRIDLLLQAHARVRTVVPEAQLVIAGDGPCRPRLERQARDLRVHGSVHFLGARTDVDSVLRAVDVGALSSDREGSPLLVFECMANDTPLVATAIGGVPDVVEHGRTGLLVPRRDPEALAQGLISLLADPVRRARMAAAAKDALRRYTIDATAARFAALYETLIARER
jgi:glycosyltransferase involved in cell wall biosynthesis